MEKESSLCHFPCLWSLDVGSNQNNKVAMKHGRNKESTQGFGLTSHDTLRRLAIWDSLKVPWLLWIERRCPTGLPQSAPVTVCNIRSKPGKNSSLLNSDVPSVWQSDMLLSVVVKYSPPTKCHATPQYTIIPYLSTAPLLYLLCWWFLHPDFLSYLFFVFFLNICMSLKYIMHPWGWCNYNFIALAQWW